MHKNITCYDELTTKSINSRLVTHFVLHGSNVIFILTGDNVFMANSDLDESQRGECYR